MITITVLGFGSCKKNININQKSIISESEYFNTDSIGNIVTNQITSFYQNIKEINEGSSSFASMPLDSAIYLMEGTYNYYTVLQNFDKEDAHFRFKITMPYNTTDSSIKLEEVSSAFYKIKDSLVIAYETITETDKKISFFDIKPIDTRNGIATLEISAAISTYPSIKLNCDDKLIIAHLEKAWIAFGDAPTYNNYGTVLSPSWYPKTTVRIDAITKEIVPLYTDLTAPGAYATLRKYGIGNYQDWFCNDYECSVYFTDVSTIDFPQGTELSTPISDYKDIPGYNHNKDIWSCYLFYVDGSPNSILDDPDHNYKEYLTTRMMNFYIKRIPDYIEQGVDQSNWIGTWPNIQWSNAVPSKTFFDFNIQFVTCMCIDPIPAYNNRYGMKLDSWYKVTAGRKFKRDCFVIININSI